MRTVLEEKGGGVVVRRREEVERGWGIRAFSSGWRVRDRAQVLGPCNSSVQRWVMG
jgi:hypothetical protein